jgi:hypothetical protein
MTRADLAVDDVSAQQRGNDRPVKDWPSCEAAELLERKGRQSMAGRGRLGATPDAYRATSRGRKGRCDRSLSVLNEAASYVQHISEF